MDVTANLFLKNQFLQLSFAVWDVRGLRDDWLSGFTGEQRCEIRCALQILPGVCLQRLESLGVLLPVCLFFVALEDISVHVVGVSFEV